MKEIVKQLQSAGVMTRRLLIAQRVSQAVAVSIGVFVVLAVVDYLLVLPGLVRAIVGLALAGAGVYWLVRRVTHAARVSPGISELAQYAERLHPELSGQLAAGVDFHLYPERYASPEMTGALRDVSMAKAHSALEGVKLKGLINPRPTLKLAFMAAGATVAAALLTLAMPSYASAAAKRWAMPWLETPWPSQHLLESGMEGVKVWPSDQPVRLRASVTGPASEKPMRVRAYYRWLSQDAVVQGWQSVIMNRATGGSDRVDPYESLLLMPGSLGGMKEATLEFSFDMSQQQTGKETLTLVQRPGVTGSYIVVKPPVYARGIVSESRVTVEPDGSGVGAGSGLVGSEVEVGFTFNKPVMSEAPMWDKALPGLAKMMGLSFKELAESKGKSAAGVEKLIAEFPLAKTVETTAKVRDEHGLESQSEQVWRVDAVTDQPATVAMLKPLSDESVLPTAVVPVEASAQDDVAVEQVAIEVSRQVAAEGTTQPAANTPLGIQISHAGRAGRLAVSHEMDVSKLGVKPGDVLVLVGVAQDNYLLDGKRHEPSRSSARQIRIIDEATLVAQIRSDLTGLRQAVARTDATQGQAQAAPSAKQAQGQQEEVARRAQSHEAMLRQMQARVSQNRLQDTGVQETLSKAQAALDQAQKADEKARNDLARSMTAEGQNKAQEAKDKHDQAKEAQGQVRKALTDLMNTIDQGRDTLAVQSQIQQMLKDLQTAMGKTQEMLPKTLGKSADQLTNEQKEALGKIARQQEDLSKRAEALTRQMQSTAQELSRQESPESQASAQALTDSAQTAKEENLSQSLEKASDASEKNQLSQASGQQKQVQKTLEKMLEKLQEQEKIKRELLKRKLEELVVKLKRLIEAQKSLNEVTAKAGALAQVEAAQAELRAQTIALTAEARENPLAAKAVVFLAAAVERQADAIKAMRAEDANKTATGQQQALAQLNAALAELEKQAKSPSDEDDEREKLKAGYLALAKEQGELIGKVKPFTGKESLTRKERADAFELAKAQEMIKAKAAELGLKVEKTLTFKAIHKVIEKSAIKAISGLKLNAADEAIPGHQTDVKDQLEAMAQALEDAQRKDDFEENNPDDQAAGGGGAGGKKPPLIPPIAEMKLLKQMQKSLIRQTVAVEAAAQQARAKNDPAGLESHKARVLELSLQQRELSGIGEELINKLSEQQPGGGQ